MDTDLTYKELKAVVEYIQNTITTKTGLKASLNINPHDLYFGFLKLNLKLEKLEEALAYTE